MGQTEPENVVRFSVKGDAPSKSNFRRSGKNWRQRWKRIKDYEAVVGWEAKAAGASVRPDCQVHVELTSFGLGNDVDNLFKSGLDSLQEVAFPDDSPKNVPDVRVMWRPDDGKGKRVEYVLRYKPRSVFVDGGMK